VAGGIISESVTQLGNFSNWINMSNADSFSLREIAEVIGQDSIGMILKNGMSIIKECYTSLKKA